MVLGFPFLTLIVFFATIALTVVLYIKTPKGYFPTDDSGFVIGATRASPDTSFQAMLGAAAAAGRYRDGRSGRRRHRLVARRRRRSGRRRLQPRHHVHQPEAAGRAGRHVDGAGDRPAAPGSLPRRRHPPVHVRRAGYPRRRPPERFRLSVHAVQHRPRAVAEMGADRRQAHGDASRASPTFPATAIPAGCN